MLLQLDLEYNSVGLPQQTLFAKLAILELCGWIENSFDLIAKRCVKDKINSNPYNQIFNDSIIGNNFGFVYKKHFRKMMISTIGIVNAEKLENTLNITGELIILEGILDSLKTERDNAAHTTIIDAMITFQAPSVTIRQLENIYPIIKKMYSFAISYNRTI